MIAGNDNSAFEAFLEQVSQAPVIVVTAGRARTPGMSRSDLADINFRIVTKLGEPIKTLAPDATIVQVDTANLHALPK